MSISVFLAIACTLVVIQAFLRPLFRYFSSGTTTRCQEFGSYMTSSISPFYTASFKPLVPSCISTWLVRPNLEADMETLIKDVKARVDQHEIVEALNDLISKDGAGSWPPRANHALSSWPAPLQPYKEVLLALAPLLPQAVPSLNDEVNITLITEFRNRFRNLLHDRVNLFKVQLLLRAAEAGRWDLISRDVYNAFYCCIASSRHAYRWATIPVVRVAQLEKELDLPVELMQPWEFLQRHFGCASESGNNTSNLVLNFDPQGTYIYKINTSMSPILTSAEESFARIFHDVEVLGLPIYHTMAHAILAYSRNDITTCTNHVERMTAQLRPVFGSYFTNMHPTNISPSVWLSHIQGFYAWGIGPFNEEDGEWEKFDGLSGNQVLLFQALDAFLGIEQYLPDKDMKRNVPQRQRELCRVLRKHSFRAELGTRDDEERMRACMEEIIKKLRMFRAVHRTRAKVYLSQPAPERLHMTAGKSLLKPSLEESLETLDQFMVKRLAQTV